MNWDTPYSRFHVLTKWILRLVFLDVMLSSLVERPNVLGEHSLIFMGDEGSKLL
jgi:hypothetical protein